MLRIVPQLRLLIGRRSTCGDTYPRIGIRIVGLPFKWRRTTSEHVPLLCVFVLVRHTSFRN
jgi:hypothetical protein